MTDLQLTKLCAEAMGLVEVHVSTRFPGHWWDGSSWHCYDPLRDDAQAMALVKQFGLECRMPELGVWEVHEQIDAGRSLTGIVIYADTDLNRPIVLCVAQMQVDRTAQKTVARSEG